MTFADEGGAGGDYCAPGEDVQTLKETLKTRDGKIATLEERLLMSKEALQGHKDKHAEKVRTLEQLVMQLRQKMAEGATGEGD